MDRGTAQADVPPVEVVADPERASVLLRSGRPGVLGHFHRSRSAADVASETGDSRQRLNHHVRALREAGFLRPTEKVRRRGLFEQRYVASARGYLLEPRVLAPVSVRPAHVDDRASSDYLLALTARIQRELCAEVADANERGARVASLALDADLRFRNAAQRRDFARALGEAVARVVAEHSAPWEGPDGGPGRGKPFRLTVGCHPVPREGADADPGERA